MEGLEYLGCEEWVGATNANAYVNAASNLISSAYGSVQANKASKGGKTGLITSLAKDVASAASTLPASNSGGSGDSSGSSGGGGASGGASSGGGGGSASAPGPSGGGKGKHGKSGGSWFTRPVLGRVPGYGVVLGGAGILGGLGYAVKRFVLPHFGGK